HRTFPFAAPHHRLNVTARAHARPWRGCICCRHELRHAQGAGHSGYFRKHLVLAAFGGGEGGIRTPDTVTRMPHFECGAFNHSATSPWPQKGQISPSVGGYVSNARRLNKSGDAPCNRSSWRPRADRGT